MKFLWYLFFPDALFTYRNPANRTCKKCGQNQMAYTTSWNRYADTLSMRGTWWENNGELKDKVGKCPCQRFVEYWSPYGS